MGSQTLWRPASSPEGRGIENWWQVERQGGGETGQGKCELSHPPSLGCGGWSLERVHRRYLEIWLSRKHPLNPSNLKIPLSVRNLYSELCLMCLKTPHSGIFVDFLGDSLVFTWKRRFALKSFNIYIIPAKSPVTKILENWQRTPSPGRNRRVTCWISVSRVGGVSGVKHPSRVCFDIWSMVLFNKK